MIPGGITSRPGGISASALEQLRRIVGHEHVLTDAESLDKYSRDETEDLAFAPDVIVRPSNTQEVSGILALANRAKIPVTPRGGGTGLSGGALPVFGGIILSMERMNSIIEIDEQNLQAVVEPGVVTQKFQEEVERKGLFYPPDPASRGSCQLGGNLAECAGGPRALKYGVTKDYVLGIEAVLADGTVISPGARVLKNVTGYNLTQLIIGSEGTLAVITKIILRLIPLPRLRRVMLAAFPSVEDAASCVSSLFRAGITPSALEFMEHSAVKAAEDHLGKHFPNSEAAAQLLIEVDGNHEEALANDIQTIAGIVEQYRASDVVLADEHRKIEEVWDLRRGMGEAVKSISPYKEEDTVVPRSMLPALVTGVKDICARHAVTSICYGHAGDGNVHVNILKGKLDDASWDTHSGNAIREIFALVVSLGGTISGEHGIGYSQKSYLPIALSQAELNLMREIKRTFDPNGILNPGKIFPDR